ncbi:MAG: universal stress protein [Deltaproteobacteria bacterium]|nr:MAG: universal stress protein [Deltaproteobacteria bacterium]
MTVAPRSSSARTPTTLEVGPPERILWLTDLSSHAAACHDAVRWFATLATSTGGEPAEVIVAHAMGADSHEDRGRRASRRADADAHLAALAGDLESVGIASRAVVAEGQPEEIARELARTETVDLVVCGRTGVSGLDKVLLGSTARRLVRELRCPVLVVHNRPFAAPRRILCPVDPTDSSTARASASGVRVGTTLALLAHAELLFLAVALSSGFVPEDRRVVARNLDARVDGLLAALPPPRRGDLRESRQVVLAESVSAGVIEAARHADLVVIGSSGRRGLARLVLGSVAEDLVERCPTHTLVVH